MTYQRDKKQKSSPYSVRLCQLVAGKDIISLWNNKWIVPEYVSKLPDNCIVNEDVLKVVTPVIMFRETRSYNA